MVKRPHSSTLQNEHNFIKFNEEPRLQDFLNSKQTCFNAWTNDLYLMLVKSLGCVMGLASNTR